MILKKIIDECKLMHETYAPPDTEPDTVSKSLVCLHCRVGYKTCIHTCSILSVKRPCDIEEQYKLNKEEK